MDQNLVDDHLKEQRRGERKQLKKKGSKEHLSQLLTILVNRAHEPCDIEATRQFCQARAPGHQNDTSVPNRLQVSPAHQFRARRFRRLYDNLVVSHFAEQEKAAILE